MEPVRSGIRLRTNVICIRLDTNDPGRHLVRSRDVLRRHLTYFELVKLKNARPLLYPPHWCEDQELTPSQRSHRNAFLLDYREPAWNPIMEGFVPIATVETPPPQPNKTDNFYT